jgi:hypothetical protein
MLDRKTTFYNGTIKALAIFSLCALARLNAAVAPPYLPNDEALATDIASDQALSPAALAHAIDLATAYLKRACGPDGKFVYRVDLGSGKESTSYDIIRHAGAMYALAMANTSRHDPELVAAMVRSAGFLRSNYIGPGVHSGQLVVWSKPLAEHPEHQYAELGGTGLGLVALAAVRHVDPEAVPLSDLQALGRFVLFLQREDGSFIHKYDAKSGPVTTWQSLNYPGEAALGLVALYEFDHSQEWLDAATKALAYLARSRAGHSTVPSDQWALIATAKLLQYCTTNTCQASRQLLIQHAAQVCGSILREQFKGGSPTDIDGAFDAQGRTGPTATSLEGLLAALEFLPKGELRHRVQTAVPRGIAFLLRAQVTSGPYAGGMPGAIHASALDSAAVRVDNVQHALCAWLRYTQSDPQLR